MLLITLVEIGGIASLFKVHREKLRQDAYKKHPLCLLVRVMSILLKPNTCHDLLPCCTAPPGEESSGSGGC